MKEYLKSSPLGILIGYVFGALIASVFASLIVYSVASNKFSFTQTEINTIISSKEALTSDENLCLQFINSWVNLLQYGFMFIFTIFFGRAYLKEDFLDIFKRNSNNSKKIYIIMTLVSIGAVGIMYGFSYLTEVLVNLVTKGTDSTSQNQQSIINMILAGHEIKLFIAVVIFAPVVEELLFRKTIFKLLEKKNVIWPLLVSSLVFALPHMLSPQANVWAWIILFINYLSSGLILGLIYSKSNNNIYLSIFCHMLNNLLAFLIIVL